MEHQATTTKALMDCKTPNIGRASSGRGDPHRLALAEAGAAPAGRACIVTSQNPIRTNLTKVGMPGATVGLHCGRRYR